jgi:hypothetical protein
VCHHHRLALADGYFSEKPENGGMTNGVTGRHPEEASLVHDRTSADVGTTVNNVWITRVSAGLVGGS